VRSDHECTTYEEALEKRRLGMWIMIRQGSAARNLEALLPLVLEHGITNCLLCTDDREPHDLQEHGHINDVVREAVALGCPPADAVAMATLNAARYHRLHEHGAVAPGYLADVEKRKQRIAPRHGADVESLVDKLFATPKAIIERTIAATTP